MFYQSLSTNYLLILVFVAVAFSLLSRKNPWLWAVLCFVTYLVWVNDTFFDITDMALYYVRAFIAFFAASAFVMFKTKLGYYQAFIQLIILIAYGCLEYDTGRGEHVLIYNNFEVVIYGLVASQFVAIFPEIWFACYNRYTDYFTSREYNKGIQ